MLIKLSNITQNIQLKEGYILSKDQLKQSVAKRIKRPIEHIKELRIEKYSLDARKKPALKGVYTLCVDVQPALEQRELNIAKAQIYTPKSYLFPSGKKAFSTRPIIIGSGPAGLFTAYILAHHGHCPLIIEQGEPAQQRQKKINQFFQTGQLDLYSNVQFGEGGAGTFSDGKLNTGVKDKFMRKQYILETFVSHGADPSILYMNKPHVGTDYLVKIVESMRHKIEELGGTYYFNTCFERPIIEKGRVVGIECRDVFQEKKRTFSCNQLVLAIGHSARSSFENLLATGLAMESKAFAIGLRIEHPQQWINDAQYGWENREVPLPAADYKLTYTATNGRKVYSFCMCPGGQVVNGASEKGGVVCNGMSLFQRNSSHSNSAIIATVTPDDFRNTSPLAGMYFQQYWEKKAYTLTGENYSLPTQDYVNFKKDVTGLEDVFIGKGLESKDIHKTTCESPLTPVSLCECLPKEVSKALVEGIDHFGQIIHGFNHPQARLIGVETRTSSPVRILRNEQGESNYKGIYPAGEGAGYAGGIMSAAIDGIKVAEKIIENL